jgi:hypothetical protein
MPTQIQDGTGTNRRAKVDSKNRLLTNNISNSRIHVSAHVDELVYTSVHQITPTAGSTFLYLKNTHTSLDLTLQAWALRVPTDEIIEITTGVNGTPSSGTERTPVNRFVNSGKVAQAIVQDGVAITGLSGGNLADRFFRPGDHRSDIFASLAGYILPPGAALSFAAVNGGIQINMDLFFEYHSVEDIK